MRNKTIILILISGVLVLFVTASLPGSKNLYPINVEAALQQSGKNRIELEKAINYFQRSGDSLKLKAIYFLILNMDIHFSTNYYWADNLNHPIAFNEFDYSDFKTSIKAFDNLKSQKNIHPVSFKYRDIDSIKGEFLIDNVERAFNVWGKKCAKQISFNDFCEYLLPYRVGIEPLQKWRKQYENLFAWVSDSAYANPKSSQLKILNNDLGKWFFHTNSDEKRLEPLPMLSPLQLLFRKQGECQDMVELATYAMRSQGIPCCTRMVTNWATSSNRHFFNVTIDENNQKVNFDAAVTITEKFTLAREPAKVIQLTYAKQSGTIADLLSAEEIPEGFMRFTNYIDVTSELWPTKDLECKLFNSTNKPKVAYACVLNSFKWSPSWWGRVENDKTVFMQVGCGAVYLPAYYINGELKPAGYPVALGYNHIQVLQPDTIHTHTITLEEQGKYLIYRPGKSYQLIYWNNSWISLGKKIAESTTHKLTFDRVPRNALLLLLPEYSNNKERPFMITEEGERIWW